MLNKTHTHLVQNQFVNGRDINFKAYEEMKAIYTLFQFGCIALVKM